MDHQPRKQLTVIQIMLLVALLGIALTIVVTIWDGPASVDSPIVDAPTQENPSQAQ